MDHEAAVHRALANPLRRRLLVALRSRDTAVGVQELAVEFGVHHNTMRAHLGVLEEAGLVASDPQPRARPGRPRLTYRVTAAGARLRADAEPGYRLLATMLAGHLQATADAPATVAGTIGAAWGRHLVERPSPFEQIGSDDGIARLVAMLDELGFEPELDAADPRRIEVVLRRCPFLDVAREHQQVVCAVHLGLMRGALDELGVAVTAAALHPFVTPDRCVTDLAVPA